MVAQAIQDCGTTGRYYCEYRDGDDGGTTQAPIPLRPKRVKEYQVTITNRSGQNLNDIRILLTGNTGVAEILSTDTGNLFSPGGVNSIRINDGDTKVVTLSIKGVEDYEQESNSVFTMTVWTGLTGTNNKLGTRNITVVDDDNTAYIGRRGYHPYGGGAWPSSPCCFTEGCAFSSASCTN